MRHALLLALLALAACTIDRRPPPATVERVDPARYAGRWHEIARLPNRFQDGPRRRCEGVTAEYAANPDGTLAVTNTCRDAANDNLLRSVTGYARATDESYARLRVTFFWPFFGNYWVIGLDPEYRWAVVGGPDRDYLWILARTPALDAGSYSAALAIARREGFATRELVPTAP